MQSHELLRQVFEASNVKQIAADIGLSQSLVYKWSEPSQESGSGAANPLDRVAALIRSTGDPRLIHWLCQDAGGFFIKNPQKNWSGSDLLMPATNQILQEFADLLGVVAGAASDNHISAAEAKSIRARWEELKSVTEGFVHCCEEGNFVKLREPK